MASGKSGCSTDAAAAKGRTDTHQFLKTCESGCPAAGGGRVGCKTRMKHQDMSPGALVKATKHPGRRLPVHHLLVPAAAGHILSPVGVRTQAVATGLLHRVVAVLKAARLLQDAAIGLQCDEGRQKAAGRAGLFQCTDFQRNQQNSLSNVPVSDS